MTVWPMEPTVENIHHLIEGDPDIMEAESAYNEFILDKSRTLIVRFGWKKNIILYKWGEHLFEWEYPGNYSKTVFEVLDYLESLGVSVIHPSYPYT